MFPDREFLSRPKCFSLLRFLRAMTAAGFFDTDYLLGGTFALRSLRFPLFPQLVQVL